MMQETPMNRPFGLSLFEGQNVHLLLEDVEGGASLQRVVDICLPRDPSERATAGDVLRHLEPFVDQPLPPEGMIHIDEAPHEF